MGWEGYIVLLGGAYMGFLYLYVWVGGVDLARCCFLFFFCFFFGRDGLCVYHGLFLIYLLINSGLFRCAVLSWVYKCVLHRYPLSLLWLGCL